MILLSAVADGATTGELARRAGTTAPNAGRQITALRDASLVTSQRHRNTTVHTVNQLGHALLRGRDQLISA
ncbi:helix-turn-helix domain-containing protein [Streptomyces sp. NPDC005969]|uniref:helix-turn-helix domain-containing protein n=1 Tax=Streptomyces sp. NPDC005969 TaxID=3156722 RepID=UPI0033DD2DEF